MDDLRTAKLGLGGHTLCLVKGGEKLTHDGRGVSPMVEFISSGRDLKGYAAADLVVGRAAAMLFVLAGISAVYAVVISRGGLDYLEEHGIAAEYGIVTDVIMNRLGTDRCPMEKAVEGLTDPREGYEAIVRTLGEMNSPVSETDDRIVEVEQNDIPECVKVIKVSFTTVADEFGFTEENAPRFTAFAINEDRLRYHLNTEKRPMFKYVDEDKAVGYYSLLIRDTECELNNLCVLPEYRHRGIGTALLEDAFHRAKKAGCSIMKIGIVEENAVLKKWYEDFGFIHTECKKYDFFPFTCGYMERKI